MVTKIPYDRSFLDCVTDERETRGVLVSSLHQMKSEGREEEAVRDSLDHPIGAPLLENWVKGRKKILIITSDHTRPVPSRVITPQLLDRIRRGSPEAEIRILIATGVHRETTERELEEKFGAALYPQIRDMIRVHKAFESETVAKGILPSGCELAVNALVDWADGVVAEGFIEPHFFAGFSGGRKSILPGIASASSVMQNHCAKLIGDEHSRTGVLAKNPLHEDMAAAAKLAGLGYIVNVVIDGEKKIVKAFSGDPFAAHEAGCAFVGGVCRVKPVFSDIVLTSNGGYPLDQNVYQSIKSMTAAEASVRDGGVIICVSCCKDGSGGEELYRWFAGSNGPRDVMEKIRGIPAKETIGDQWMAQILARIMLRASVIMVTCKESEPIVTGMGMLWAESIGAALRKAKELKPDYDGITVIPDGISVIVRGDD